ncbi:MAG: type II toxin-antitoxin system death-on-curing family toxin [Sphingomicrobium sp.]
MSEWNWLSDDVAEAVHDEQLAEHGGGGGIRDPGALLSALARPQNLAANADPDAADLAAAYAFGVSKDHPFIDGNKRTAWVLARLFLVINGAQLNYGPADAVLVMLGLAAGELSEQEFATWFRERVSSS